MTIDEFYSGCSKPRCPELMRILSDLEYVEQSGFGINKIIEVYGKEVFNISDNFISVVLPFDSEVVEMIQKETTKEIAEEIKSLIIDNPKISAKEMAIKIGITADEIRYHLNKMKKAGLIKHSDSTKTGYWEMIK